MKEKRKYPRIKIRFPIYCHRVESCSSFYSVFEDISKGGLQLIAEELLAINESVKFKIKFLGEIISGQGKVVWCRSSSNSSKQIAGVKFTRMESRSRQYLSDFLFNLATP